jgi:hypothetical protein
MYIDYRTKEEILREQIDHAAHVCRKHINRDFAGHPTSFVMNYDNAERASYYARICFRRAADLFPALKFDLEGA